MSPRKHHLYDFPIDEEFDDPYVMDIVKKYNDSHFPDITTWVRANIPDSNLLYKDSFSDQVVFVRDKLAPMLNDDYKRNEDEFTKVISTHRSKSVRLPVFMIDVKKLGLMLVLRNNFYDWKVSVISQKAIKNDFYGLFNPKEKALYCEGFPEEFIFGTILENNRKFTVEINNVYNLYTFCYLLRKQLSES